MREDSIHMIGMGLNPSLLFDQVFLNMSILMCWHSTQK